MQFKPLYSVLMLVLVLLLTNCRKEEFLNNKVPIANAGQSQTVNVKDGFATATLRPWLQHTVESAYDFRPCLNITGIN